jgi:alpha-L-rhamnosidase
MSLRIEKLRCEYTENPLGIDTIKPRFSWILLSDRRNTIQTAYHIQVAASKEALMEASDLVWDSGVVKKDSSLWVGYDGNRLESFQRYWWRVRVSNNHGEETDWTEPAFWARVLVRSSVPDKGLRFWAVSLP